jgi:hypothetical protein
VRAIKKPITLAVLDEVVKVLEVGHYSKNVARSLRENGDELRGLVLDKLKEDQTAGRFKRVPFHDTVVQSVIDTSLRVTLEVLADPRIDEFVAHAVSENVDQIRLAVERGLHQPSLRVLRSIADALHVSSETLLAQAGLLDEDDDVDEADAVPDVERAIRADPRLSEAQKDALVSVYRSYVTGHA